jgi:hypothetical protein
LRCCFGYWVGWRCGLRLSASLEFLLSIESNRAVWVDGRCSGQWVISQSLRFSHWRLLWNYRLWRKPHYFGAGCGLLIYWQSIDVGINLRLASNRAIRE